MNSFLKNCVDRYLILREYFKFNDYPPELICVIMESYFKMCDYEIFLGTTQTMCSIIKTPLNDTYYWPNHDNFENNKYIKLDQNFRKIIKKDDYVFGITVDNELYSWGGNNSKWLGRLIYTKSHSIVPNKIELSNVKDVVCGYDHVAALTLNGDVYSWGSNGYNQLGRDDINLETPGKINISCVKELHCGKQFTIAITVENKFYSWGRNDEGQLGLSVNSVESKRVYIYPLKMRDIVVRNFVSVLTEYGSLYTWGKNTGQLGLNIKNTNCSQKLLNNIKKVVYNEHCEVMAINYNNELYGWGNNQSGNLGLGHCNTQSTPIKIPLLNVKDVVLSRIHTLAIKCDGELYSWGDNKFGQLGLGNSDDYNIPQKVKLSNVRKVFCNVWSSFAITDTNELYSWGSNHSGQLGLGHDNHVNIPRKVSISHVKNIFLGRKDLTIIVTYFGDIYYCGNWYAKFSSVPKKLMNF